MRGDPQAMQAAVRAWLEASGCDLADPELATTPQRVADLWQQEFLSGYQMDPASVLGDAQIEPGSTDAVVIRDLAFHSMCPHHLMPYQGRAHLAYLPGGRLVGFGKLARLVTCFTQRLVLQERATEQIAGALMEHLGAKGAGCVLEARQLCLGIPHDRQANNRVVTSTFVGSLDQRPDLRAALLAASTET